MFCSHCLPRVALLTDLSQCSHVEITYFCDISLYHAQTVTAHIFNEMYMQSDTTAAVLSVVGLLHQAVVCECEDLSYAIDEAVYTFIRVSKSSIF